MKKKVCGLKDINNIKEILALKPDFVGFIFYKESPRFAESGELASWIQSEEELFGETKKVGVFVNSSIQTVLNNVHDYQLDFVQLHGDESPEYCAELRNYWQYTSMRKAEIIKAFSVDDAFDFNATNPYAKHCAFFIFDTKSDVPGGSGMQFNWKKLGSYENMIPYLLSGGIKPEDADVVKALDFPQLIGVDINSGFEDEPGIKNPALVEAFFRKLDR